MTQYFTMLSDKIYLKSENFERNQTETAQGSSEIAFVDKNNQTIGDIQAISINNPQGIGLRFLVTKKQGSTYYYNFLDLLMNSNNSPVISMAPAAKNAWASCLFDTPYRENMIKYINHGSTSQNMNDWTDHHIHCCLHPSNSPTGANSWTIGAFLSFDNTTGFGIQLCMISGSLYIYFRSRSNNTWGNWYKSAAFTTV